MTPMRMSFDVACPVAHAFEIWTERIGSWWPSDHSVSGEAGLRVHLEGRVGGRIYEQTADGTEHDWGQVTEWHPPVRLAYRWHLRRDAGDATQVQISFVARGPQATRVEIEHTGWERLVDGPQWRERNVMGWQTLLPHYVRAIEGAREMAAGTKDDPWVLRTPPGSSEYTMYRDEAVDPPALVCQVGSTKLTYRARAIDDLHAWLAERGDWVPLGSADEGKAAAAGTVEEFGRAADNPVGGWYGLRKGYRGRFGMYLPPLLEELGLAELTHDSRNNSMRAR